MSNGKNVKGAGKTLYNSITLEQRVKLFDWCKERKDSTDSYNDLATMATKQLGFTVSMSTLQNHWSAVNGSRFQRANGGTLAARINELEKRIAECERRLTDAGA